MFSWSLARGTHRVTFPPATPSAGSTTGPRTFTGYRLQGFGWMEPRHGWGSPYAQALVPLLKQYVQDAQ